MKDQRRKNAQAQATTPNPNSPKRNHLYPLHSRSDQEKSPDVFIFKLQVFSINAYASLDPGATLSFHDQGRENDQPQAITPNPNTPKRNHFYPLSSRSNQEESADVFIFKLQVFPIHAYALLDPGATLHF